MRKGKKFTKEIHESFNDLTEACLGIAVVLFLKFIITGAMSPFNSTSKVIMDIWLLATYFIISVEIRIPNDNDNEKENFVEILWFMCFQLSRVVVFLGILLNVLG